MQDHELVALISTVLGIVLTLLKFFLEGKNSDNKDNSWKRLKRGFLILLVGFSMGVATCFYLFVGSDWKFKKALRRFIKKQKQPIHQPRHHRHEK